MSIFTRLKKDRRTAADFQAAIDEATAAVAEARGRLDHLVPERKSLLLEGTDGEIASVEAQIAAARLAIDRGEAAIEELRRLQDQVRAGEREAMLDRLETEFRAEASGLEEDSLEYTEHARKLVPVVDRAKRRRRRMRAIAAQLRDAGRAPPEGVHVVQFEDRLQLPAVDAVNKAYWWSGAARGEGLDLIEG